MVCLQDFLHICKRTYGYVLCSAATAAPIVPVTEIFREPRIQNLATDPCLSCKSAHQRFKKSEPETTRRDRRAGEKLFAETASFVQIVQVAHDEV